MEKEKYIKPEIECIELETEGIIAASGGDSYDLTDSPYTGPAGAPKRRSFWGDDEE